MIQQIAATKKDGSFEGEKYRTKAKAKKENLISGAFSYSGFIMKCIERANESTGVEFAQGS